MTDASAYLSLALALLAPWLLGWALCLHLLPRARPGTQLGFGFLVGHLLLVMLLKLANAFLQGLSFYPLLFALFLAALVVLALAPRAPTTRPATGRPSRWAMLLMTLLAGLLALRYGGMLAELLVRPLQPWDAYWHWTIKARTWFYWQSLVPIGDGQHWWQTTALPIRYQGTGEYPVFAPLLQLWAALAIDRWDDALINIPWLLLPLAFGLALYGSLRQLGQSPPVALLAVYLLLSLPYLNTHAVLAGYVDLWMGLYVAAAALALLLWMETRSTGYLALLVLLLLALPQLKKPGLIWAALIALSTLMALLPRRWGPWLSTSGLVALLLGYGLFLRGFELPLPGLGSLILSPSLIQIPGLGSMELTQQAEIGPALWQNLMVMDNWHLLMPLLAAGFLLAAWRLLTRGEAPALFFLNGASLLILIFMFAHLIPEWIASYTSLNRALLHLAPLWLVSFWWQFGDRVLGQQQEQRGGIVRQGHFPNLQALTPPRQAS